MSSYGEQRTLDLTKSPGVDGIKVPLPPTGSHDFPYLAKPDGSWICRFCCSVPHNASRDSSVWKVDEGLPPTTGFIVQHLRVCPGTPVGGSPLIRMPVTSTPEHTMTSNGGPPRAYVHTVQGTCMVRFGSQLIAHNNSMTVQHSNTRTRKATSYHCVCCRQHFDRWKICLEHMKECCPEQLNMRSKKGLRRKCTDVGENKCLNCGQPWRKSHVRKECCPQALFMNFSGNHSPMQRSLSYQ